MSKRLHSGQQIVYVPPHAMGDIKHPHAEYGFVTSVPMEGRVDPFCRYFYEHAKGRILRTVANSERTPLESVVPVQYTAQLHINELMRQLGYESEYMDSGKLLPEFEEE